MLKQSKLIMMFFLVIVFLSMPALDDVFAGFSKELFNLQKQLKELGYNPGPIDGVLGKQTEKAIKQFQHDNNLKVSGVADMNTVEKISFQIKNKYLTKKVRVKNLKNSILDSGMKPIVIYNKPLLKGMPFSIKPYGEGKIVELKRLHCTENETVSLEVVKKIKEDFCLVFFFRANNEFITVYLDIDTDFTIHSSGTVLLGTIGHQIQENKLKGKIKYKIKSYVWGQFDMRGAKGELYVFAVKGSVSPHSILPGEQNDETMYKTSSNVLECDFIF